MTAYFPEVPKIQYGGPKSRNPLAFKHYNADEIGRRQDDEGAPAVLRRLLAHVRQPAVRPLRRRHRHAPWDDGSNSVENAQNRVRVAFEFIEKLGAPFYAFHDRDVAPEGATLKESQRQPRRGRQGPQGGAGSAPASSCSGARPTCSPTRATCTARPPARTSTSSPSPPPRSRRPWRSPTTSAARATPSGAGAKATRPCSTPT